MEFLEVTHANANTKVIVVRELLFSFYYSEGHKAVLLMSTGGGMIPVKESLENVSELLKPKKRRKKNGRQSK